MQRDIDLIVETDRGLYFGDCKWTDKAIGASALNRLRESAKPFAKTSKLFMFVLFAKRVFTLSESSGVLLFDAKGIVHES